MDGIPWAKWLQWQSAVFVVINLQEGVCTWNGYTGSDILILVRGNALICHSRGKVRSPSLSATICYRTSSVVHTWLWKRNQKRNEKRVYQLIVRSLWMVQKLRNTRSQKILEGISSQATQCQCSSSNLMVAVQATNKSLQFSFFGCFLQDWGGQNPKH